MDRRTKIIIAFPLILIVILVLVASYVPFGMLLSASELEILNFTPSDYKIIQNNVRYAYNNITDPLDIGTHEQDTGVHAEGNYIHKADSALSLVVISGNRKMAILMGKLVKEGDIVNGMKVAKIEPDRVLLSDKTLKWVYLKEGK